MKICLTSYSGAGAWYTRRLIREKHDVTYYLNPDMPELDQIGKGLVPKPKVGVKADYANFDLSIFDMTGRPRRAEASHEVCATIGDGLVNCKLEDDRAFGIEIMEAAGINVPPYEEFNDAAEAIAFVKKSGKRYVFKPYGDQASDATYVSDDALDMIAFLKNLSPELRSCAFILQEFIKGTEFAVEGWFDGKEFWLLNFTLEDKKFMNDNKGPNTGCSGNLLGLISSQAKIYREGLEKAKDVLSHIGYKGMIDLNTIVTDDKAYGLEWTPRFGYDSSATLMQMYAGDYGEMLASVANGLQPDALWLAEYGTSVRLSIPPYPSEIRGKHKAGVSCKGIDVDKDYWLDLRQRGAANALDPDLETVGVCGFIAAPIIVGNDPIKAFEQLYHHVEDIHIPNMQYRTDCDKSAFKKLARLKSQGWV